MKVSECMTPDVFIADPAQTIREAAKAMLELDIGMLLVSEGNRLVGVVTDRDIAVRGVAEGMPADARIGDVMTTEVNCCFVDQEVDEVLENMADIKIRHLPVLDRQRQLVGILSLSDLAAGADSAVMAQAGITLGAIAEPGGVHSQRS
jgi:CBS domain-containing protein